MDAAIPLAELIDEIESLVESGDFDGAEEMLTRGLSSSSPALESFYHYQFGKLYAKWNKLSSAALHLGKAAELAKLRGDELFTIQVVSELRAVRERQLQQRP